MKRTKIYYLLEFLSAAFVLSYLFIHNIILVMIGITFSLYLINIEFITRIIRSINKFLVLDKSSRKVDKNDKEEKIDSININLLKKNNNLTLVETVEELGFIPSINKNIDNEVA